MQQLQDSTLAKNASKIMQRSMNQAPARRGFTFYSEKNVSNNQAREKAIQSPTANQQANQVNIAARGDGDCQEFSNISNSKSFPLAIAQVGQVGKIAWFSGGRQRNFLEMGLIPGTEFQVISRKSSGSAIIAIGANKIGLGKGLTQHIMVTAST